MDEVAHLRAANRSATAEAIAEHVVQAEEAEREGDEFAARFHRSQAARLQAKPLARLTAIEWPAFWDQERSGSFLIDPWLPESRQVALYGSAKSGKSEIALYAGAGLATGRDLNGNATEPGVVLYLDHEMTEDDLEERLRDFGYGPDSDLSRLVYVQHGAIPPLDTDRGGTFLAAEIDSVGADLVVIDTLSRVVEGEENVNDTFVAFARHTGNRLRKRGCALLRLDHTGKDVTKGARGASAKADDVDAVYRLVPGDNGTVRLDLTHRRIGWLESLTLSRSEDETGVRYRTIRGGGVPAGTAAIADLLDELEAPTDIGANAAVELLRTNGHRKRRKVVLAGVRYRREGGSQGSGTTPDPR